MEAYSKEFRRDVLRACDAGGGTREVALKFDVSESWVRRIKQERREQGKVAPKTTRSRRKAAALAELGWQVSDVTLSRACRALRRTRKKRR